MRQASASLIAFLLSGRSCTQCDLYSVAIVNGTTFYWTSHDRDITIGAVTYSSMGPQITRSQWGTKNHMEIPELDITIQSTGSDLPGGGNLKLMIHNGLLDGATFTLERLFMQYEGDTSLGTVLLFSGQTSTVKINALGAQVTVKGANNTLAQYMPKNMFERNCIHNLYDSNCAPGRAVDPNNPGPSRGDNTFNGVVESGSTNSVLNWQTFEGGLTYSQFVLGYVTMKTGVTAGQIRTIQGSVAGVLTLIYPLYETPATGDQFTVTYGCSKTKASCQFFNQKRADGTIVSGNLQHRRAFPFIPPAEAAL